MRIERDEAAALRAANRRAAAILAAFLIARLGFAWALSFGIDESYTLAISRDLSLSYFDHPPLHQWIAHFAALALGEGIGARLPFILLFAATGWLLYRLTFNLFGDRAALVALLGLNAAPFFFASAGSWVVPDGPLLFGLALAARALASIFFEPRESERRIWRLWLLAGFGFGLAGLSKYIAVLAVLGVLAFLALSQQERRWFRHPAPYAAGALVALMVVPVVVWNAQHGWASIVFQGGRGVASGGLKPAQVLQIALGQVAYLSPWLFLPLVGGLVSAVRLRGDGRWLFFLCLSLPAIVFFTAIPLWGARGLPHWTMPGWFFAFPLMGAWVDLKALSTRFLRLYAAASVALLAVLAAGAASEARTGWLARFLPPGAADPTLEALDWRALRDFPLLNPPPAFIVSTRWSDAGKIALALGTRTPVFVASDDPRGWAFVKSGEGLVGRDGVAIVPLRDLARARQALALYSTSLGEARPVSLFRGEERAVDLAIFPVKGLTQSLPPPYPARP